MSTDTIIIIGLFATMLMFFGLGWIFSRYRTETRLRREQLRRELELQRMATFSDYLSSLQGGRNV